MRGDMKRRKKKDESKNRISRQGNFFSGLIHLYKWVHPGPINALHDRGYFYLAGESKVFQ